ncbi:MAG: hypothetical protein JNM66_33250 [Bryobacterales bacterium]|nr:hypothetical protein [Bryobacterales bacterium]
MRYVLWVLAMALPMWGAPLEVGRAVVVVRPGELAAAEKTAATVLVEEVERRTGARLRTTTAWPAAGAVIALAAGPAWGKELPESKARAEGYRILVDTRGPAPVVWIVGADARGVLYGVGHFLRRMEWGAGKLTVPDGWDVTSAPAHGIRGHQLGFRATANSWDAWTVAQFERYIRELALFGMNSVEGIPFGSEKDNPLLKVPKTEMNRAITEICLRYGMDYWTWTPVTFDVKNRGRAEAFLDEVSAVAKQAATLTGVFVPGGDPGDNEPEELLPYLGEIAQRVRAWHPKAKVWVSMQGFSEAQQQVVYRWLGAGAPVWFGGIVAGPSSPPEAETRQRMPAGTKLRLYPDVSHNKLSQFEVPEWDQAFALTLGREAVNPRPMEYAAIHARIARVSDGSITYSDGVHDDVNKVIWSALDWEPGRDPRDILMEYCRLHFSPAMAEEMADAILALERNWRGPVAGNGAVEATLRWWRELEARNPELEGNWRWQMCLLRAYYDAQVRRRVIWEAKLEEEANGWLLRAAEIGAAAAVKGALEVLNRATAEPAGAELRTKIVALCERLWQSIQLQTSVGKYGARGPERGAVLEFIDIPLNNRWWLEDELAKAVTLPDEKARVARLRELAMWEKPGPGSFYDDLGNIAKMPHVVGVGRNEDGPLYWWWENGRSRARHSWQVTMWPKAMEYDGLDPKGKYVVRTSGLGQSLLRIDDTRVQPSVDGREMGEFKEYPVPADCLTDGRLRLTWDKAGDEVHLNWRQQSRLAEVWLLKK